MKKFEFTLKKMQNYQEQVLQKEKCNGTAAGKEK